MTNDDEVLYEIQLYLNQLKNIAEKSNSFWILARTCFIQAKISLITLDLTQARRFMIQGKQIAEKQRFHQLTMKFEKEFKDLKEQENIWETFKTSKAPISDRMKLAKVGEYMREMLRNRTRLITQIADDDFTIHKERKVCLVCRGEIKGYMYACECNANYCEICAQALTNLENVCWACNAPLDNSKPIKIYGSEEDKIELKKPEKE
jgi:hypothetical protein